jgi:hypothetical protein
MLKMNPATTTQSAANTWILALCSFCNKIRKPLNAYVKLASLLLIENFCFVILRKALF